MLPSMKFRSSVRPRPPQVPSQMPSRLFALTGALDTGSASAISSTGGGAGVVVLEEVVFEAVGDFADVSGTGLDAASVSASEPGVTSATTVSGSERTDEA